MAELRTALDKIPDSVADTDDMRALLVRLNAIGDAADKFVTSRTGELNDLNARLGELGNVPAGGAAAADITRRRATLTKERNALDAEIRLARLVTVDAQQRGSYLIAKRRALFEARLTERAPSPLGGEFWRDIGEVVPVRRGAAAGARRRTAARCRRAREPAIPRRCW